MNKLIRILTIQSIRELLRYKSFLFLIFFLVFADRIINRFVKTPGKGSDWLQGYDFGHQTADFVFKQLPELLFQWLFNPHVIAIAAGLFLLKQAISLWPSSDMRQMHRKERGRFGVLGALAALRWYQVVWDALAVGLVCSVTAVLVLLAYLSGRGVWAQTGGLGGLFLTAGLTALVLPLALAGLSYSSKLAIIGHGTFGSRFRLFLELFINWRIFWTSWLFFSGRSLVEVLFVGLIPASAIVFIDNFWLRMAVATISASPVYAYLKMASFKFFLETYRGYELVKKEYRAYYTSDLEQ